MQLKVNSHNSIELVGDYPDVSRRPCYKVVAIKLYSNLLHCQLPHMLSSVPDNRVQIHFCLLHAPNTLLPGGPNTLLTGGPNTLLAGGPITLLAGGPNTPLAGGPNTLLAGGGTKPHFPGAWSKYALPGAWSNCALPVA